jgi:hypothetical protein
LTKDKYWYKTNIHGTEYDCYGIVLGRTSAYERCNTFVNHLGQGWDHWYCSEIDGKPGNALIRAKFEIVKF